MSISHQNLGPSFQDFSQKGPSGGFRASEVLVQAGRGLPGLSFGTGSGKESPDTSDLAWKRRELVA